MEFLPTLAQKDARLLKTIFRIAKKKKVKLYLVGGYLRDMLLNREKQNPDIDFCLKRGAINFARGVAREIRAGFVVLDKAHGCARLVKRIEGKVYTLDFTDFRGKTLEEDLKHRDFTINALSADLEKVFLDGESADLILDPYAGRKDLKAKTIRLVNQKGFDEDPLRILRAFSLSAIFGFKIDKDTQRALRLKRKKLSRVSYERIRDELFKILDTPCSYDYLAYLDKMKILEVILPEIEVMRGVSQGPYHHLDVWKHTLETLRQYDLLMVEFKRNQEIQDYLDEFISTNRRRYALIKLGALLHDIGKPKARRREEGKIKFHGHERVGLEMTKDIAERLKLSNDELNALGKMVLWHLRPGYLADNEEITPRAIFRFFRDAGKEAVSTLLISLADQRATRGPLTSKAARLHHEKVALGLIRKYFKKTKEKKLVRLVTGDDLIRVFRLGPSPLIGKILRELEELQAIGRIKNRRAALEASRKIILKHKA